MFNISLKLQNWPSIASADGKAPQQQLTNHASRATLLFHGPNATTNTPPRLDPLLRPSSSSPAMCFVRFRLTDSLFFYPGTALPSTLSSSVGSYHRLTASSLAFYLCPPRYRKQLRFFPGPFNSSHRRRPHLAFASATKPPLNLTNAMRSRLGSATSSHPIPFSSLTMLPLEPLANSPISIRLSHNNQQLQLH